MITTKILVTGATGTVGGSVARALADTAHQTVVLVRDPAKYRAPEGMEVIQGDLTVADDVGRALTGADRAFLNMADDNGATFAKGRTVSATSCSCPRARAGSTTTSSCGPLTPATVSSGLRGWT